MKGLFILGALWLTTWLFLAAILSSNAQAEVLRADQLTVDGPLIRLEGSSAVLGENAELFAKEIHWVNASVFEAKQAVIYWRDLRFEVEQIVGDTERQNFVLSAGTLWYQGRPLAFEKAEFNAEEWLFYNLEYLPFKVEELRFYPRIQRENLLLKGVFLFDIPLGYSTLSTPHTLAEHAFIAPDANAFLQPLLEWRDQGVLWGGDLTFYQSLHQRFVGRFYSDPIHGFSGGLRFYTQPAERVLLDSELQWRDGLRGHQYLYYDVPEVGQLQGRVSWRERERFWQDAGFPQGQVHFVNGGILHLGGVSNWFENDWGALRARALVQQRGAWWAGGSLEVVSQRLWWSPYFFSQIALSTQLAARRAFDWGLGGRVSSTFLAAEEDLSLSLYLEQWWSSLPENTFLRPGRKERRVGLNMLWNPKIDWGLGFTVEYAPEQGEWVTADLLVSYEWSPLRLHLYLRALPLGVSLQNQWVVF